MSKYGIWVLLVLLAAVRVVATRPVYQNGQRIRITGAVVQEPAVYSFNQRIILQNLKIYLPKFPEIHYGDRVVVEGLVEDGELKESKLISLKETENYLIVFKRKLVSFWQKVLPEPHASLVAGITLGFKSSLPEIFQDSLRKTGTTHVVVASGMNVTFVATFTLSFLIYVTTRRRALIFASLGIIAYCVITGFEAPVVRAAVMSGFAFLAQGTGRITQSLRLAAMSALVMLAVKPSWITDVGFILSFASTISLILFEVLVRRKLLFVPGIFRESISTSLAAQVGVAPILFLTFGQFNPLSPVINALVLWVVPIVMIIGSVGGIVGLIVPELGKIIIYLCYPLTSWFIWVVQTFSKI